MTTGSSLHGDAGLTLVELLIASSLLLVALAMFGLALNVSQRAQIRDSEYSYANDSAHLALVEMDRQLRSGYAISEASPLTGTTDSVKIFTMTNAKPKCAMWAIATAPGNPDPTPTQNLYVLTWTPGAKLPDAFTATTAPLWRMVASDIVDANANTFKVNTSTVGYQTLPTLEVLLHLNAAHDDRADQAIEIQSVFTSRNYPRFQDPYLEKKVKGACE